MSNEYNLYPILRCEKCAEARPFKIVPRDADERVYFDQVCCSCETPEQVSA